MNNEIKEILDNFKDYEDRYKKCNETRFIIFYRDIYLLLDYITKLQEENERLKEIENFKFSLRKDETKTPPIVTKNYKNEYEDYKSRNEKAIEYIKKEQICEQHEEGYTHEGEDYYILYNSDVLLDILGDK